MAYVYLRIKYINGTEVGLEESPTGGSPWHQVVYCEEDGNLSYLWPSVRGVMQKHLSKVLDTVGKEMTG